MLGRTISMILILSGVLAGIPAAAQDDSETPATYERWKNGLSSRDDYFPIAVWLQNPRNANRYREAGINLYIGLWKGPTEEQLSALKKAGMQVICAQNETGLNSPNADVIVGWMHGDEPDNAQPRRSGGYGPPIEPKLIQEKFQRIRERDSTRPVLLNLGQGVAYDNYIGRGVRRNHMEDYPEYIQGCDIVSFDIYPVVHDKPEVAGKLEFVPRGVRRLRDWSDGEKIVWNCIECSRISNTEVKPTPEQIRAEVWMSIIAGSKGIIYFVHQFEPNFNEASLLADPQLLAAITDLNQQIARLAPVLHRPTVLDAVDLRSDAEDAVVQMMCKEYEGSLYVFLANESPLGTEVTLKLQTSNPPTQVEVHGADRMEAVRNREFTTELRGYGFQLLRFPIAR
jgi:hypothetical protein